WSENGKPQHPRATGFTLSQMPCQARQAGGEVRRNQKEEIMEPEKPVSIGRDETFQEVLSEAIHGHFGGFIAPHVLSGRLSGEHMWLMSERAEKAAEEAVWNALC